jgi:hypothetical protein
LLPILVSQQLVDIEVGKMVKSLLRKGEFTILIKEETMVDYIAKIGR